MAQLFKLEGIHSASLPQESINLFKTRTETPGTNDGRGVDTSVSMTLSGPIRSVGDSAVADETINLARWATEYDDAKAYSQSTVTAIASGQVLRNTVYPNAFVVSYSEEFNIEKGVGSYKITMRQKKDLLEHIQNTGGYTR